MSAGRDTMELREADIRAQYDAALALITGFDHAPRLAKAVEVSKPAERSPGIGTRPMFRSTTPGMVTRSTVRAGGVRLIERVEALGDGLVSPVQAGVLHALRRGVAIALAMGETFAAQSGLAELKKANLEGRLPELRRGEVSELLAQQLNRPESGEPHERLSDREMQVFTRLAKGHKVTDIGEALSLSVKTVSTYRPRIMEKTGLSSNSDLTSYALMTTLID